ncbi:MAG TPA: hypothetical protein VK846_10890, partial [Candidatus Limnocylindria bacterium]|nr:hypothetical protein [Candidatus Limnocylindria bacterium]
MSDAAPQLFSAAQIATALDVNKRVVLKVLGNTFTKEEQTNGNRVRVWTVAALPETYRATLFQRATRAGFRSLEELLAATAPTANGSVRFHEASEYHQVRAQKLQAALRTVLHLQHKQPRAELLAVGLRDYKAAFGDVVTPEHFWNLLDRTVRRAGTSPDWEDANLYLDDNAVRRSHPTSEVSSFDECAPLTPALAG